MSQPQVALLPLSAIRENPAALRDVKKNKDEYKELVESVRSRGVINAISVREVTDTETGETYYSLVDGLHRFSAAQDAGLKEIPVTIATNLSDTEALENQIIANTHKIITRPAEFARAMQRILASNQTLTVADLAARLNRSKEWLKSQLTLRHLDANIAEMVDDGHINLSNALALAKLPKEEQVAYSERAQNDTPAEFLPVVAARVKELKEANQSGKDAPKEFTPTARARSLKEIKAEYASPTMGPALCEKHGVKGAAAGFALGVKWAIRMDPDTIEAEKAADAERKAQIAEKRASSSTERKQRQAEQSKVRTARLELEAALAVDQASDADVAKALKEFDDKHGLVDGKFPKKEKAAEAVPATA